MACMPQCTKAAHRWGRMINIKREKKDTGNKRIGVIIRRWLFAVIMAAFFISLVGIIIVQSLYQREYSYQLIETYVEDVSQEVDDSFTHLIYDWAVSFTEDMEKRYDDLDNDYLIRLVDLNREILSEINIVDGNGIIVYSSCPEYVGWDIRSGKNASEFICLLQGEDYYEQGVRESEFSDKNQMIYVGKAFSSREGFIQYGVSYENYDNYVDETLSDVAKNRRIGFMGDIVICEENLEVIGSTDDKYNGMIFDDPSILPEKEGEIVRSTYNLFGEKCYAVSTMIENHYIIGGFSIFEAAYGGNLDKVFIFLMNGLILFSILIVLSKTLDRHVISGIENINGSLARITGGDLEEKVSVKTSLEFTELSDGINQTVDRLKDMIAETEARIEEELETARSIQQTSLPNCTGFFRRNRYFELWADMETAKTVGGDFYDFYMLPDDILVVTMADVSDKGIPAAMFMMRAKTLMKSLAEDGLSVEAMAEAANKGLWENNEGSMFVTAWIGFIDLKTGKVRYVHAGHTCPVLFGNREPVFIRQKRQMLMGGMPDVTYEDQEFVMEPGESLFLYTDGVTEAEREDEEQYGNDRLLSVLSGMNEAFEESTEKNFCEYVCNKVVEDVHAFAGEKPQSDDITVLCVRYKG